MSDKPKLIRRLFLLIVLAAFLAISASAPKKTSAFLPCCIGTCQQCFENCENSSNPELCLRVCHKLCDNGCDPGC